MHAGESTDEAPVVLHRHVAVLLRPGGRIQFGADPATCLVFPLPDGVAPGPVFSALLAATRGECLRRGLEGTGLPEGMPDLLVAELARAGLVAEPAGTGPVTVIGRGGLRARVTDALRLRGWPVTTRTDDARTRTWLARHPVGGIGLAVLAGFEVPDAPLLATLRGRGIPHLSVCFRDGAGVVGPWVPDAGAPCPACAEADRADADPARGVLALQLAGRVAAAPPETMTATVATVVAQVRRARSGTCALRAAEATVDPHGLRGGLRPVLPHPRCPVCAPARASAAFAG